MKRAERRAERDRLKRRRAAYYGGVHANDPAWLGKLIDTPTPCSCWMCRSPRYAFKTPGARLTRQEIRMQQYEREES